jgi:hypothetical protein
VRATRPFYYGLAVVPPGAEVSVPYPFARELIANNKAVKCADAPEAIESETPAASDDPAPKAPRKAKPTE